MSEINIAYLELRLSGGASNTAPTSSLGGAMSSEVIRSKSAQGSGMAGLVYDDAPGSPDGAGTLAWDATAKTLTWTPNGASAGAPTVISADGRYAIPGSSGYLFVTATFASLPGTNATDTIAVAQLPNRLFDDITRVESYLGDSEYRCFYVHNAHPTDGFIGVKAYVGSQPNGADKIDIGLDPSGLNGTPTAIVNEGTTPSGVSFSRPSVIGSALSLGQIAAGQSYPMWEKRTVPAQTYTPTLIDLSSIIFNVGY